MSEARVALVTGASRGIGAAIAQKLAGEGYRVAGTATSEGGSATIAEALGDGHLGVVMDVRSEDSVTAALAVVEEALGTPVVVVNNAGITQDNLMLRMSAEQWSSVMDTNTNGLYRVTKPLLRGMMKARFGRIVNVSSVIARRGNAGQANYAASKGAVEGFTRALAQEVGSRGITVNAIAPGFIETEMTAALDEGVTEQLRSAIALGRFGAAEEVASLVAFLASDGAGYITGETIAINGGLYMN